MKDYAVIVAHYNRVLLGLVGLAVILVAGTAGYMVIEGWSFLDALYMTAITITTVGYREVKPLSDAGMVFTVFVLFVGVGAAFYILTALVSTIIEGDLRQIFGERRLKIAIERLSEHHIVCGFGRVGEEIARELRERHAAFVVVDNDPAALDRARQEGFLTLDGDATLEETLVRAGIHRCASLIAALDSDAANTYITLTAKLLRPEVYVVARVASALNEPKLKQAGADHIVSPYQMGGRRMALSAMQPNLPDLVEIVSLGAQGPGALSAIAVDEDSGLPGKTIAQTLASAPDVVVLAVRSKRGTLIAGPSTATRLAVGDTLMVFGPEDQLSNIGSGAKAVSGAAG